ncbi:MAG TPA: hypothetical protein VGM82_08390 [Gemmatimonadaceae bacterium]
MLSCRATALVVLSLRDPVRTRPGGGTVVEIDLPLPEAAATQRQ